jgi:hypothetical protein
VITLYERNIYALDNIYRRRQKVLRVMEFAMEEQPLGPRPRLLDKTRQ